MNDPSPKQITATLEALRAWSPSAPVAACWATLSPADWPALFCLLDIGADLPRLRDNPALARLPVALWPELATVTADLVRLQALVEQPIVPPGTKPAPRRSLTTPDDAKQALEQTHCTTIHGLFDSAQQGRLEAALAALRPRRAGTWGEVERDEAPALFSLIEEALGSAAFHRLTGFDLATGAFSVTLSLQSLEPTGIAWHRDLYWPREWVGRDVFAVFYALGADDAEKGGAFVYYVPWENALYATYRQHHDATILWNSADTAGRILHAVTGYHGADTSRHLLILQCLRADSKAT